MTENGECIIFTLEELESIFAIEEEKYLEKFRNNNQFIF